MKKIKQIYVFIIATLFIITTSCMPSEEQANEMSDDSKTELNTELQQDEMITYSLPSPMQIASVLKILNIGYSEELLIETKESSSKLPDSKSKALMLGMYTIDMGYSIAYEQPQVSIKYLSKIDELLTDLNIGDQKSVIAIDRFRTNINDKDSLSVMLLEFQQNVSEHYANAQKDEMSLLIMSGMYIEGLYLTTELYNKTLVNIAINKRTYKSFNNLLLQQQLYTDNIIELLSMYNAEEYKDVITDLTKIQQAMDKLQVSYTIDESKSIKNINLDYSKLEDLKEVVNDIRGKMAHV